MSKITHEQVRERLNKIYYHYEDIPRQEEIEQYFLQQEKQENLLTKIKEVIDRPIDGWIFSLAECSDRYDEIEKLIKELENE